MNIVRLLISGILLLGLCGLTPAQNDSSNVPGVKGKHKKPTAKQVFELVERLSQNPNADRRKAERFLQNLLDDKVRFLPAAPEKSSANRTCYYYSYDNQSCVECDEDQQTCWCSTCCIAASQKSCDQKK
jgi:hypothetical protein